MISHYARGSPALSSPSSQGGGYNSSLRRKNKAQELYEEAQLRKRRQEERDHMVRQALEAHIREKTGVINFLLYNQQQDFFLSFTSFSLCLSCRCQRTPLCIQQCYSTAVEQKKYIVSTTTAGF